MIEDLYCNLFAKAYFRPIFHRQRGVLDRGLLERRLLDLQWQLMFVLVIGLLIYSFSAHAKTTVVDQHAIKQQQSQSLNAKMLKRPQPSLTAAKAIPNSKTVTAPKPRLALNNGTSSAVIQLRGSTNTATSRIDTRWTSSLPAAGWTFLPLVLEGAEKWQLESALLLAIMHTESAFDPDAHSHKGAIGLMQIMPQGAVLEVVQKYYSGRQIETDTLSLPEVNIEIGSAYLHILSNDYLHAVRSDKNRRLLMIAAYNCGLSNLMRALTFTQSLTTFTHNVNQLSEDALYFQLTRTLPIAETRHYVEKVMHLYERYRGIEYQ